MGSGASTDAKAPVKFACKGIQADRVLFTTLDNLLSSRGGSGLTVSELHDALALHDKGGINVEEVFKHMDRHGRGRVTREDFMATMREVCMRRASFAVTPQLLTPNNLAPPELAAFRRRGRVRRAAGHTR